VPVAGSISIHILVEVGDVIDALVKKEDGDSTEWDAIVTARAAVKTKHPKE